MIIKQAVKKYSKIAKWLPWIVAGALVVSSIFVFHFDAQAVIYDPVDGLSGISPLDLSDFPFEPTVRWDVCPDCYQVVYFNAGPFWKLPKEECVKPESWAFFDKDKKYPCVTLYKGDSISVYR